MRKTVVMQLTPFMGIASMNENNPHLKMFVADMLMNGMETLPSIIDLLNDRRLGGWRNIVTRDFTIDDVRPALEELARSGLIDVWRDAAGGPVQVESEVDIAAVLAAANENTESLWFRLTTAGREAVETWEPPETFEDLLIEYVQSSSTEQGSLHSAYQWLNRQADQRLPFTEFADLIDYMLEYDYLRLWQSNNNGISRQGWEGMVRLLAFPAHLNPDYKAPKPAGEHPDPWGYFLTLGDGHTPMPELKPLVEIADPSDLIKELTVRSPHLLPWFTEREVVRHIVITSSGGVTIGAGSVSEFRVKVRWGKGLSEVETDAVRHIVLDETGEVIGDYYGPALSDPYL